MGLLSDLKKMADAGRSFITENDSHESHEIIGGPSLCLTFRCPCGRVEEYDLCDVKPENVIEKTLDHIQVCSHAQRLYP